MNTRVLALVGDRDASALRAPLYLSSPEEKDQFLGLVRSNEDMGNDYLENDFMSPTTEEIQTARPLVTILPEDVLSHATLIAPALRAGAKGDDVGS